MAGRRPKPTALKRAQGNPGKQKLRDDEPTAATGTTAPAWLTKRAKSEWRRVMSAVKELGTVTKLDRSILAVHCQSVADYAEAVIDIDKHGQLIAGKREDLIRNPSIDIANHAASVIRQTAIELGFTPAARSKVIGKPKEEKTDFEKFMSTGGIKAAK